MRDPRNSSHKQDISPEEEIAFFYNRIEKKKMPFQAEGTAKHKDQRQNTGGQGAPDRGLTEQDSAHFPSLALLTPTAVIPSTSCRVCQIKAKT